MLILQKALGEAGVGIDATITEIGPDPTQVFRALPFDIGIQVLRTVCIGLHQNVALGAGMKLPPQNWMPSLCSEGSNS